MNSQWNEISLDTLCAALCYAMGVEAPEHAAQANPVLTEYVDKAFGGAKADRVFMYNTDAIAQWVYEKYPQLSTLARSRIDLELPMHTVIFILIYLLPSPYFLTFFHKFTQYKIIAL